MQARADYSAVEGLLPRITGANMTKLVEQAPGGTLSADVLAKYGLDKPALTVTVGAGSSKASLAFGKEEEGTLYARDLARPMVFGVDTSAPADLKKPADDYRNKNVFEFRSFNLARLRCRGTDTQVRKFRRRPLTKRTNGSGPPTAARRSMSRRKRWTTCSRN